VLQLARDPLAIVDRDELARRVVRQTIDVHAKQPARTALGVYQVITQPTHGFLDGSLPVHQI
jgi:hypothetical protein